MMYKGYRIEREYPPIFGTWYSYAHEDYDGPEDIRCGVAKSIEAAKAHIDDLEDFNEIP